MIVWVTRRRSGKSTKTIEIASATRSLLVVPNESMARIAERQAREMNCPLDVCTADQYFLGQRPKRRVVIDELEMVLNKVFGADIIMATTTGMQAPEEETE